MLKIKSDKDIFDLIPLYFGERKFFPMILPGMMQESKIIAFAVEDHFSDHEDWVRENILKSLRLRVMRDAKTGKFIGKGKKK